MTENLQRTNSAEQHVQQYRWNRFSNRPAYPPMLRVAFPVLMMYLIAAASVWADYQAGVEAYERGNYKTALQEWLPLAEGGNLNAQFQLGWMYDNGEGVPQDHREAVKWFHKDAEQGDANAQLRLGLMYELGRGVVRDEKEAVK